MIEAFKKTQQRLHGYVTYKDATSDPVASVLNTAYLNGNVVRFRWPHDVVIETRVTDRYYDLEGVTFHIEAAG